MRVPFGGDLMLSVWIHVGGSFVLLFLDGMSTRVNLDLFWADFASDFAATFLLIPAAALVERHLGSHDKQSCTSNA